MQQFLDSYISYDGLGRQAYLGKDRLPLSREEFYKRINRLDLVEKVQDQEQTRNILYGSAVGAAVVGVGGSLWFSLAPPAGMNPNTQATVCAAFLVVGLVSAGLLVAVGARTDLDPISSSDAEALTNGYNAELRHRLGIESGPKAPVSWSWSRLQLTWR